MHSIHKFLKTSLIVGILSAGFVFGSFCQAAPAEVAGNKEISYRFEEYIEPYGTLPAGEKTAVLKENYNSILKAFKKGTISKSEYNKKIDEFDEKLRRLGIFVPYQNLSSLLSTIKGISAEDKKFLLSNEKIFVIPEGSSNDLKQEEAEQLYQKAEKIFHKYGLDFNEAITQLSYQNYNVAVFDIDGDKFSMDPDKKANIRGIDEKTRTRYVRVIRQVKSFVPQDIWKRIVEFEFNTDGVNNVLAHTLPENDNSSVFRLAIDINDNLDEAGNLTGSGKETVIHELAHMITLNETQLAQRAGKEEAEIPFTDHYMEHSYLTHFYQAFWKDLYPELKSSQDSSNAEYSEFYKKYKDWFVSDYASTDPVEDIAESFRVFVFTDKPAGTKVADQKILFFYQYDEFVKWRENIRSHLSI